MDDADTTEENDGSQGPPRMVVIGLSAVGSVVAVSLILLMAWLWVTARVYVVSDSGMAPAIFGGDEVHADVTAFGYRPFNLGNVRAESEPSPGDVVVFEMPPNRLRTAVLRVVAVGGDEVRVFPDGSVDIHGVPLARCPMGNWPTGRYPNGIVDGRKAYVEFNGEHAYVVLESNEERTGTMCVDTPCQVPVGQVFLLGDNRSASQDSRDFGLIPLDHVVGKVKDSRTHTDMPAWEACFSDSPASDSSD